MASESAIDAAGRLSGPVTLATLADSRTALNTLGSAARLDLSHVTELDTAGAWLIARHLARAQAEGRSVSLDGASAAQTLLLQKVTEALPPARRPTKRRVHHDAGDDLERFGAGISAYGASLGASIGFFGQVIAAMGRVVIHPSRLRGTALVHHMHQAGLNAVPIVALMGFLIGIVLAFQGATQLQQFGAEVFVVDLIAISILRELGILLTAIIVAGRSASAFTAAIGSMKMREEIDAMRVLGLDPIDLLVLPRILALIFLLPVLGFIANMAGLLGGGLMAWVELGISPGMFRTQLLASTDVSHALVGLSKAPVFALIIGIVGCHQGLQVRGNTESLGNQTSKSVVIAIFMVIVVDALFSVFFAIWGV
ncbi:ABC transporter permease [Roseicitreum antarcticum]|uniref:Phospholipid/cholesterol/gamma-HCH transport system permease protein n=1 Tax=Roseicitreum antarcticum TaxID=564137 RepID=A0A1H2QIB5_9RHOB|nr:MlaE family lipid ABC transporter permease subunit [Roseicitreum antarcticum]SDW06825.1 phospholipid/cholesterol/gamma-HCH transport system permease protein [Roseicitreum antarcticum]